MQDLQYIDIGFIQIDDRRGVKKLLRIIQVFGPGLKNKFKTQLASKEIYTEDWGVELDHILEYDTPTKRNTRPLLFAASNKEGDTEARKVGSAVFIDTSRYPVSIRTWRVNFFLGTKLNTKFKKYQLMINKELIKEYTRAMLPIEHRGLQTLEAKTAYFDLVETPKVEDMDLEGIGNMYDIVEKAKNYLLFECQKAKAEVSQTSAVEEEVQTPAIEIAKSIVKEQEDTAESEKEDVVKQALTKFEVTAHKCRVAIVTFLYNRVYVDGENTVTRPIILEYMLENFEWSRSTVYRHFQKLERSGFLKDLPGQNTTQEFKIVGFDHRLEEAIRELCEARGWKFGGRKLTG